MESGFGSRWGWLLNATQVAEMEHIPLDKAYDLSTINFLNDLAYLKDKAREDKRIQEQWRQKAKSNNSY